MKQKTTIHAYFCRIKEAVQIVMLHILVGYSNEETHHKKTHHEVEVAHHHNALGIVSTQHVQRSPKRTLFASTNGSVTAEYVIATLAAVSFAGLLVIIMRSDEVRAVLTDMVRNALQFPN